MGLPFPTLGMQIRRHHTALQSTITPHNLSTLSRCHGVEPDVQLVRIIAFPNGWAKDWQHSREEQFADSCESLNEALGAWLPYSGHYAVRQTNTANDGVSRHRVSVLIQTYDESSCPNSAISPASIDDTSVNFHTTWPRSLALTPRLVPRISRGGER